MTRTEAFYRARQLWGSHITITPMNDARGAWFVDEQRAHADSGPTTRVHHLNRLGEPSCHPDCIVRASEIGPLRLDPDLESDRDRKQEQRLRDRDRAGL
jgi:hypothetical protein